MLCTLNDMLCEVGHCLGSCWIYLIEQGYGALLSYCTTELLNEGSSVMVFGYDVMNSYQCLLML